MAITTVNSSTSAQLLQAADGSCTSLTIQNTDANELFLGPDNTVSPTNYTYRRTFGTGYTFDGVDAQQTWYGVWDFDGSGGATITTITTPASDSNGAFSTYGTLKTEISAWLRPNSAVTADMTARIPKYVGLAEVDIRRDLHARALDQTEASLTITSGSADVPTGLLAVLSMALTAEPYNQIRALQIDQLDKLDPSATGGAYYYARVGSAFKFYPRTTSSAQLRYRRGVTPLANDADTNWVLQAHPDLYLAKSLAIAATRLMDPRLAMFDAWYTRTLDAVKTLEMDLHTDALYPQPSGFVV